MQLLLGFLILFFVSLHFIMKCVSGLTGHSIFVKLYKSVGTIHVAIHFTLRVCVQTDLSNAGKMPFHITSYIHFIAKKKYLPTIGIWHDIVI